jgi:hypothetical protein
MNCGNCKQEVTGEVLTREGQFEDGTMFVLILRSRDCDWANCDGCSAPIHMHCYPNEDTRYCSQCIEKYKLNDSEEEEGYEV